jgi:hypothetical protein
MGSTYIPAFQLIDGTRLRYVHLSSEGPGPTVARLPNRLKFVEVPVVPQHCDSCAEIRNRDSDRMHTPCLVAASPVADVSRETLARLLRARDPNLVIPSILAGLMVQHCPLEIETDCCSQTLPGHLRSPMFHVKHWPDYSGRVTRTS